MSPSKRGFKPSDPDAWKHGVETPKYRAVLHVVHPELDDTGKQRCLMCRAVILNHGDALFAPDSLATIGRRRLDAWGRVLRGFPMGPVTTIYPPEPELPPVTVIGHVKYARPCTIPEKDWPHA